jgi:hypothetical protein
MGGIGALVPSDLAAGVVRRFNCGDWPRWLRSISQKDRPPPKLGWSVPQPTQRPASARHNPEAQPEEMHMAQLGFATNELRR